MLAAHPRNRGPERGSAERNVEVSDGPLRAAVASKRLVAGPAHISLTRTLWCRWRCHGTAARRTCPVFAVRQQFAICEGLGLRGTVMTAVSDILTGRRKNDLPPDRPHRPESHRTAPDDCRPARTCHADARPSPRSAPRSRHARRRATNAPPPPGSLHTDDGPDQLGQRIHNRTASGQSSALSHEHADRGIEVRPRLLAGRRAQFRPLRQPSGR
jgi:hypothetical protein